MKKEINYNYTKLKEHIGHKIIIAVYGNYEEICVECEDCCEVIYSESEELEA